jgi:hypothetical protein
MRTPAAARRRNAKDFQPFPVCPWAGVPQICTVRRFASIAAFVFAAAAAMPAAADPMDKFGTVAIDPAAANLFIATVSMAFQPFVRHNVEYSSTYVARVFPFFYTERGRISIVVPDDLLHRVDHGEPVDFVGRALSDSGDSRKVEGHAVPTGPLNGRIRVRVFISRRLSLTYDTTYELTGAPAPPAKVTARGTR